MIDMIENTAATCTVNVVHFVEALRDLIRTAGTDTTLPMLYGVLLHTDTFNGKTVLVGTSTDRFRLGQSHVECTGSIAQTLVSLDDCKRLVAILKLYAKVETATLLEFVSENGNLTVRFGSVVLPVGPTTMPEHFPKLSKIFDSTAVTPEREATFNAKFLGVFASIADARLERLHVQMMGEMRPMLITIGEHYRGLLMPTREKPAALPWFVPANEQAEITAKVQREAEHERAVAEAKAREERNAKRRAARAATKAAQPEKKPVAKKPAAKRAARSKAAA
jgi:hypothetical protein